MPDLKVDQEAAAQAAQALRMLAAVDIEADPAAAADATGDRALADAAAVVGADHRRAAAAISADALTLAEHIDQAAAQLLSADAVAADAIQPAPSAAPAPRSADA
ncbi:hypothetical protein [Demequina capsici]|uniref:Uncharacterized protein n=1 Tax=Demequina capsici TaxID=3075620 RepID=A0AA96F7X4_9MICO|nr:hypothetical protein [Demequina sp. OYTSA14]WNM24467.1 hypothetical protein RN606_14045 [Demequina sp. OYTSA14]